MVLTEIGDVCELQKKGRIREVDDALHSKRNKTLNPVIISSLLANLA